MQNNKKVLILTDDFPPYNNANGICSYRYAKAFLNKGYEVHVLCFRHKGEFKEQKEGVFYIHRWRPRFFFLLKNYGIRNANTLKGNLCYKLAIWLHRFKGIIFLPLYPLESPLAAWRFCRKAGKIISKYKIPNVIAGFMPAESASAAIYLKRRYKVKVIFVCWDTFTNTDKARKYPFIYNIGLKWEHKIFTSVDVIAQLKANIQHYNNCIFDQYRKKFCEIDIPFPEQRKLENEKKILSMNKINFMYMGGLSVKNNNLHVLLKIIDGIDENYIIHFFTRGDAESYLRERATENKKIVCHGQVPLDILNRAQDETDIFITLGPVIETEVNIPSKIFECMGSGKMWIHIYKYDHDVSLPYIKLYPLGLEINANAPVEMNIKRIENFVKSHKGSTVTRDELARLFPEASDSVLVKEVERTL